jgi:hypothetical protein
LPPQAAPRERFQFDNELVGAEPPARASRVTQGREQRKIGVHADQIAEAPVPCMSNVNYLYSQLLYYQRTEQDRYQTIAITVFRTVAPATHVTTEPSLCVWRSVLKLVAVNGCGRA